MIGVGGSSSFTNRGFTLGDLIAFRAYWWRLYGPVQTLARVNDMVQKAMAAARRVFEVLDAPDELPDAPTAAADTVRGAMEIRDVTFRYPADGSAGGAARAGGRRICVIEPGQTVALCGPSGSGKSTVLNLLLRFYDPTPGPGPARWPRAAIDPPRELRKHFALVQQETFLFNDSILDNIRYGHPEATMEQVIAAAKAANAHGFISDFPRLRNPRRRARRAAQRRAKTAHQHRPGIPGQSHRASARRADQQRGAGFRGGDHCRPRPPDGRRTTVLTSHRPSLINQADMVYVIEDGRVTSEGSPEILAQK